MFHYCVAWAYADESRQAFDIPQGLAIDSIKEVAHQSGVDIVFDPRVARTVETPAILGSYAPRQALELLLAGTPLVVIQDEETAAFAVRHESGSRPNPDDEGELALKPITNHQTESNMIKTIQLRSQGQPDNSTLQTSRPNNWLTALAAVLTLGITGGQAQETNEDDIFDLSPFVVSVEGDQGYEAQNTLSGTRLNTPFRDLGLTVTALTEEFWEDTAFSSVNEMLIFTPGAERSDTQINDSNARAQYWGDNTMFRGVQIENIVRNQFRTNIPSDTFNATRFEFSRGPNSVLFGVTRDTAGFINRTTQDAVFYESNLYRIRADEHGTLRHELNLNRVLVDDKLAIRGAFLLEDKNFWIEPGFQDQERSYLAVQYRPVEKLSVKVRAEQFDWVRAAVNWSVARDEVTPWIDAGRPGISVSSSESVPGSTYSDGLARFTGANQWAMIQGTDGSVRMMNMRNFARGSRNTTITGQPAALPLDFLPLDKDHAGSAGIQMFGGHNVQGTVHYELNEKIHFEYAANTESIDYEFIAANNPRLYVDANTTLSDGVTPNPEFGKYYAQAQPTFFLDQERYLRAQRLAGSLSHDFEENDMGWLGKHDIVVMAERNVDEFYWDRRRLVNQTPREGSRPINPAANNPDNWARIITYFDPDTGTWSGPTDSRDFQRRLNELPGNNFQWMNQPNNNTVNRTEIDSFLFVWQSRWWQDRIVATLGWREDEITQFDKRDQANTPGYVHVPRTTAREQGYALNEAASGITPDTINRGITYHALENIGNLDYFSFFYNYSDSFAVQNFGVLLDGSLPPPRTGDSENFGVRFQAFDRKISGSFTLFEVSAINATFRDNTINNPMGDLFDLIGRDDLDDFNRSDTRDLISEGWEFQVTANFTQNWRVMFGLDHYKTFDSNVAPLTQRLIEENRSAWLADPSAPLPDNENITAQEAYDDMIIALDLLLAQAGGFKNNERRYKSTILTNYSITEGGLKGFAFGGNVVWRDENAVGFPFKNDPELGLIPDVNNPFMESDILNMSLHASYSKKIWKDKIDWKIQLNLRNIGDEDPFVTRRTAHRDNPTVGIPDRISKGNPQTWVLTSTFKW